MARIGKLGTSKIPFSRCRVFRSSLAESLFYELSGILISPIHNANALLLSWSYFDPVDMLGVDQGYKNHALCSSGFMKRTEHITLGYLSPIPDFIWRCGTSSPIYEKHIRKKCAFPPKSVPYAL